MYREDELLIEEEVGFLNFAIVQDELKIKVKSLRLLIVKRETKEINKILKEIENILD
jgi:hypothetical protein